MGRSVVRGRLPLRTGGIACLTESNRKQPKTKRRGGAWRRPGYGVTGGDGADFGDTSLPVSVAVTS